MTIGDRVRSRDRHHWPGVIEKIFARNENVLYGVRCDDGVWRLYFEDEIEPTGLLGSRCPGDDSTGCGHGSAHIHSEECDMSCACWTELEAEEQQ